MEETVTLQQAIARAREAVGCSAARAKLSRLFDEGTFVETGVFVRRNARMTDTGAEALEGVVTGYGAVDGALVYAFAQDGARLGGAIDENHAAKIEALYHLALSNGAPVVGIFDSCGASVYEGVSAMAAYGKIISCVTEASGAVPQVALIDGPCTGVLASVAAMFDFVVSTENAELYVSSPTLTGVADAQNALLSESGKTETCLAYIRALLAHLPAVCDEAADERTPADDPNRAVSEAQWQTNAVGRATALSDAGSVLEVYHAKESGVYTCLASVGGVRCGILASDPQQSEGKLTAADARRAARFVSLCDAYDLPLVTLVDAKGVAADAANEPLFSADLARLARSYAEADIPMITLLCGRAIGAAYILLGSKAVGADLVYALPQAEVGILAADAAVAFAQNDKVTSPESRLALEKQWAEEHSSALCAAAYGEVDDIIDTEEVRARVCSALYMLRGEGPVAKRHTVDIL